MSLLSYIKIDRRNNLHKYDEDNLIKLKLSAYATIAFIEEDCTSTDIMNLLNDVYPNLPEDGLQRNLALAKQYIKMNYYNRFSRLVEESHHIIEDIISSHNDHEFTFNTDRISDICKVLVCAFCDIESNYKMKKLSSLLNAVRRIIDKNIDVIQKYHFVNKHDHDSVSMSTNLSSSDANDIRNPYLPDEMIVLINKYQMIRKLRFFLPLDISNVIDYYILLQNIEWLFPNLIEIELDLESELSHQLMKSSSNSHISNNSSHRSKSKRKDSHNEINNKQHYKLILLFFHFSSKIANSRILTIKLPYAYQFELNQYIKNEGIFQTNFHPLQLFKDRTNLYHLNISFNSLDSDTFERVIFLINNCNHLRILKLSLFTSEEYYTQEALMKLCNARNINLKNIMNDRNKLCTAEEIINILLENFEENMNKLFFVIHMKINLCEFSLANDIPNLVLSNGKFVTLFHKFLFNILGLIHNNLDNRLQTLKLNIPFLPFDGKKYPTICHYFDSINYTNRKLRNLTLDLKFNSISNITNLIPTSLTYLSLGGLDIETFIRITDYIKTDYFTRNSKIEFLRLSVNKFLFIDVKSHIFEFFASNKPKNLKEIDLATNLAFDERDLEKILRIVNYDTIEKYKIQVNKNCNRSSVIEKDLYFTVEKPSRYRSLPTVLHKLGLLMPKIYKNIKKYMDCYEKKQVIFSSI